MIKLTLLGTGGPRPDPDRHGSGLLLQIGEDNLLFDAGRGTTTQLVRAGVPPESLSAIFITHHHYDHIGNLAEVLLTGWNSGGGPPRVFGPRGTRALVETLLGRVYADDISTRLGEATLTGDGLEDIRRSIEVRDVGPGRVWQEDDWWVGAEQVDHMHGLGIPRQSWDCLGYRVETDGKIIAISGDTVDCPGLERMAQGADVLVQCCYLAAVEIDDLAAELIARHMLACSPDVGRIAARAGVKKLVLTHFRQKSPQMMARLAEEVSHFFHGELILGEDLLVVEV